MNLLIQIRQMMAEGKFSEASIQLNLLLLEAHESARLDLLSLLLECHSHLERDPSPELVFEFVQKSFAQSPQEASRWFEKIKSDPFISQRRSFFLVAMKNAELRGHLAELKELITRYQIQSLESSQPSLHPLVHELSEKYFKKDYALMLQRLALSLAFSDVTSGENLCRQILLGIHERTLSNRVQSMMEGLLAVLDVPESSGMLIMYRNYCQIYLSGLTSPADYKKIAELVICFDDFELQVLLLQLLNKLEHTEVAASYADHIRSNSRYSFVYLDKHFPELKGYFLSTPKKTSVPESEYETPDLTLAGPPQVFEDLTPELLMDEPEDAERRMIHLLRHQNYSFKELTHLAVSFLQSDMPLAASEASGLALKLTEIDELFLKACYLKISALMLLQDYRAALDYSWQALQKAQTRDDLLSLLYTQADCHSRLHHPEEARRLFSRIIEIDSSYRLARERLERLNEA